MAQNVVVGLFEVESEAFQAITELRQSSITDKSCLSSAILVKKENGVIRLLDGYDKGTSTADDAVIGGLIGSLLGILGGPIGVLLGSSYGMLIGSAVDVGDALEDASLLEQIASKMEDNDIAIIGLAFEEDEKIIDETLGKFKVTILRYDAAVVAAEVEEAQLMQKEMARQARAKLRDEKREEIKGKIEEKREKLLIDWEEINKTQQNYTVN